MRVSAQAKIAGAMAFIASALAGALPAPAQTSSRPRTWAEQPLSDELIEQSMQRAVEYLWKKQNPTEFHWEPQTMEQWEKRIKDPKIQWDNPNARPALSVEGLHGGWTALALLGLLKAGVSPEDPRFDKALKWLAEQPVVQTYSRAMRAALLASLNRDTPAHQQLLEAEKKWLLDAIYTDGTYGYFQPADPKTRAMAPVGSFSSPAWRDLSNTQYGVLGVWLLSDAGVEVPEKYWKLVQHCFLTLQNPDGSWPYFAGKGTYHTGPSQSMTLAGLASLFVVWDKTYATKCDQAPDPELVKSITRGLEYLARNFNPAAGGATSFPNQFQMYTLYGIERVGVAGGLKYFGDKNWWDQCAKYALFRQLADGSWPPDYGTYAEGPVTTAYALLFYSYGRAPVVFNKLAYGSPAQWNSRPRDLARLTVWMGKTYEKLFNWQVMPIDRPVEELLDAPILLMSGKGPIVLKAEEKAKLKEYVLGGGLLLGEAADHSKAFCDSFRALVRELFAELEMQAVPPEHPLYTVQFPLNQRRPGSLAAPPLEHLSNGVRTLVVLSPRDLGCTWQRYDLVSGRVLFELAGNLMQYVSDRGTGLVGRGTSYQVKDLGNRPQRQVTVGRVVWGSKYQWDPEPASWGRLDVILRNRKVMQVATKEVDFSQAVDPRAVAVVHVTGVAGIQLTDVQRSNLKRYVADGGLVFADAAGGADRSGFNASFQKLCGELFGPLVPASPPFVSEGTDEGKVQLRHVDNLPRVTRPLGVLGYQRQPGSWGVLYVPCDVTAALAGYANVEPVGLTPQSAEKFVSALLTWVISRPATQPGQPVP